MGMIMLLLPACYLQDIIPPCLSSLPIEQVIVTDSLCRPPDMGLPLKTVSLKRTLAEAIVRLHE